MVFVVFFKGSS